MPTIQSTNSPAVSVVVPLFNEEENLPILQAQLRAVLSGLDYEIIFVDDGSIDRTAERIEAALNVRVVRFEKNAGQSGAIYAGLKTARGATAVLIDGDLQNDPADIPKLLAEIERGADLVCGYRAQRKDTLVKRLTSWVANFVRSRFTKDGVHDTGCTLKAMRRECIRALVPFKGMHRFIPALIKGAGYRLVDLLTGLGKIKAADRESILASLKQREETMSTGIGFGIAIPHASSDRIDDVVASFGRSSSGIEFDALDNAPVKFVVLFIVPKNQFQTHLCTLASIAKFLNDRATREKLAAAKSTEEILSIFRDSAQK